MFEDENNTNPPAGETPPADATQAAPAQGATTAAAPSAKVSTPEDPFESFEENKKNPYEKDADPDDVEKELEAVYDVPIQLSAILGRVIMPVSQLLKLGRGAVVELDRKVGESIDIYANNRLIARGEVVMVQDRLGVTMTEIVKGDRH
jgi:flagellar motor switch protein FliN/FliY